MDELREWLSTDQAAQAIGYSRQYIRTLVKRRKIEARKVARDWLVNRESLLAYKARMDRLGTAKHDPRGHDSEGGHR